MEIDGKRFLVVGSGEIGSRIARALAERGAQGVATARAPEGRPELAADLGTELVRLEITDPASREAALDSALEQLGGLDGLVLAAGAVAFGPVGSLDARIETDLIAVNATGPMSFISAAVDRIDEGGAVVALSAVVAEYPTADMAAYSASKAALSAYVTALRRERRKQLGTVLEVRPGHMETGFSDRALAGEPPRMPEPEDPDELVSAIVDALVADRRSLAYDPMERSLQAS